MKRIAPLLIISALALTGCVPEAPSPQGEITDSSTQFVQDLWVIDSATVLNSDYEWIEVIPTVVNELQQTSPDETVKLLDNLHFHRFDSLHPRLTDSKGTARTDVSVIAGLIETDTAVSLAALGTPRQNTAEPIGIDDYLLIDLSVIDYLITPGDPVLLDYSLAQAIPDTVRGEPELGELEKLKHRFEHGLVQVYGSTIDGKEQPLNYIEQLGIILQGSEILGLPAKSQDMVDGLWDGTEACIEEFRDPLFGLKCTQAIFEDFGFGAISSWQQIEENFEPHNVPGKDEWEKWNAMPEDSQIIPQDSYKPKNPKEECMAGFVVPEGEEEPDCPPPPCTVGCGGGGMVIGDPHITSFDGKLYPMHGVGEFIVAKNNDFELQMRTQQTAPDKQLASVSAVAFEYGDFHVFVDAQSIWVNGEQVTEWYTTFGEHYIVQDRSSVQITNGRDYNLRLSSLIAWEFNIFLDVPFGTGDFIGMLGNNNGQQDDFFTRDGRFLGEELDFRTFYQRYVNSWRVSDDESLFPYETGRSTADYTDLSFPAQNITSSSFPEKEQEIAERICLATGLKYADFIEACKLDILVLAELDDLTFIGEIRVAANHYESAVRAMIIHGDESDSALWGVAHVAPKPWEKKTVIVDEGEGDGITWMRVTWENTADKYLNADGEVAYSCPGNGVVSPVWGGVDGIYDERSSICTAAVHAGMMDPMRGGEVFAMRMGDTYTQDQDFVQNGIVGQASEDYIGFMFLRYDFEH